MKAGDNVIIAKSLHGHKFKIGEKVMLISRDDDSWLARNNETMESWYINPEEIENPPKKYKVVVAVTTYCYLDVDATSPIDAKDIANEADGADFYTMEDLDPEFPKKWEIVQCNPI